MTAVRSAFHAPDSPLSKPKNTAFSMLLISFTAACALFVPFIISGGGIFTFYGDFNVQQIPFYQLAHDAVRDGSLFWNWNTDLGANFIGSYSFYLLGSPFFWLTLPFPSACVPYLMGPLLILKFTAASMAAYAFLRRFVRGRMAVLGGLLYGFSGFSIYNIFFNHFHEAIIVFPLMLLGLERLMKEDKRLLFGITVFFSALSNYYFFIGQVVFLILYFILRALSGEWTLTARKIGALAIESVVGTAMACVLLAPAFFSVIQNGRVNQLITGFNGMVYDRVQRLPDILHSFFFAQDMPARPNFFPDADNKWASMSAWLPVFSCVGVFGYFQSRRHNDWLKRLMLASILCACIPLFNAAFQMFNAMYYARWFYMMVLMLVLATVTCLNDDEVRPVDWKRALIWTGAGVAFFALFIGLMPQKDAETGELVIGLMEYPPLFWAMVGGAVACLGATAALIWILRHNRVWFYRAAVCAVSVCVVGYGAFTLVFGRLAAEYPAAFLTGTVINHGDRLSLPDRDTFYRVDFNSTIDNLGMFWKLPTIQAFQSIVPGSVMDYYRDIGVDRGVASRPTLDHYGARALLSVRYLFEPLDVEAKNRFLQNGETRIPGWSYYDRQNDYLIYQNDSYIPMGFSYDYYLTGSRYEMLSDSQRELVMLKALVIDEDDRSRMISCLSELPGGLSYTQGDYLADCAARRAAAVSSFAYDRDGFTAVRTADRGNYVFFSVPYESGWSATVDGAPAEILKVNAGFMAVYCPAGTQVPIRFTYRTPGLLLGAAVSGVAAVTYGCYTAATIRSRRKRRRAANSPLFQIYEPLKTYRK